MQQQIKHELQTILEKLYTLKNPEITLETPPKKELGDFAYGPFLLARELKKWPPVIASEIKAYFDAHKNDFSAIVGLEVAGPYLNIKMNGDIMTTSFFSALQDGSIFAPFEKKDEKIVVDYIGMNVGKPMHIGHMCTPNIGQAMINLYKKLGYDVISDSHIGDWGIIFWKLITAFKLWWDEAKLKENAVDYLLELYVKITAEAEKDETLEEKARNEFKLLSHGNEESKKLWAEFTSYSIKAMNMQLARLHVHSDYNIGESFYEGLGLPKIENNPDLTFTMKDIVKELIEKKIATQNDDGSVWVIFADETKLSSCILQKRDGTHGYLASDLACIKYRSSNWNPDKIIYFVDVRQELHFKQAFQIAKSAGWVEKTELFHAFNGFISWKEGPFSTRKGNIIKLDRLLDEAEERAKKIILEKRQDLTSDELNTLAKIIGIGAIKYGHLKKSRETDMIFDWDEFMTFEGNSGPYIQYAYVRAKSILTSMNYTFEKRDCGNETFTEMEENELIKGLLEYKNMLVSASKENMPHIIANYAYELTKRFNAFYNTCHIQNEQNEIKKYMRADLVYAFSSILKETFGLLSIDMPERM